MPWIRCPTCHEDVTAFESTCPYCGGTIPTQSARTPETGARAKRTHYGLLLVVGLVAVATIAIAIAFGPGRSDKPRHPTIRVHSSDLPGNQGVVRDAPSALRTHHAISRITWVDGNLVIAATSTDADWQRTASDACKWLRTQLFAGPVEVSLVDDAANPGAQLAHADCP